MLIDSSPDGKRSNTLTARLAYNAVQCRVSPDGKRSNTLTMCLAYNALQCRVLRTTQTLFPREDCLLLEQIGEICIAVNSPNKNCVNNTVCRAAFFLDSS